MGANCKDNQESLSQINASTASREELEKIANASKINSPRLAMKTTTATRHQLMLAVISTLISSLVILSHQAVASSLTEADVGFTMRQLSSPAIELAPEAAHLHKSLLRQPPVIEPFTFGSNVRESQRLTVVCSVTNGELPLAINWLKDGQLLTPQLAQAKRITIKPDSDSSTLKFYPVKLEHAGNYTCATKNLAGVQTHSAQLLVHGEPRWIRDPQHELKAIRGQTIVIDCQTTGWPKPQQSWQIKTHSQSEYAPLAATGRISLAANGSLIIHNADKSDEANYQCKSYNGIGKGISGNTLLRVNVPAHFESAKQQPIIVRKQNRAQLRCDAHGDEPITIEWFKNKQRITNDFDERYSIRNSTHPDRVLSLLVIQPAQRQDNSIYECVTRNPVGTDRLPIELIVQEEPDNIQELQATQINSRSVTLIWTEPYDGRSSITSYMFHHLKLEEANSGGTGLLTDLDLLDAQYDGASAVASAGSVSGGLKVAPAVNTMAKNWQGASRILLPVQPNPNPGNGTTRSITIDKLDPSTKYLVRALAINAIGESKFSLPMEFVTEEEAPEIGPTNIRAQAINSTSIQVSWDEIPKSKQLGRIHGYYIGYRVASQQQHHQTNSSFVYKPYVINDLVMPQLGGASMYPMQQSAAIQNPPPVQRLETNLQDLKRDTAYEITVVAFNSRGSGPPSADLVLCKTIEMEAPKPVKLQKRLELNESIFIEWQRDPLDQNPVDYYDLYQEKNSASQEWVRFRLPGNQSHYKARELKCGTRYQFYIVAHNKVGKSASSEVVSASTSGKLPVIPTKTSLIKMVNSTCLSVNLNSFQDNGCRIKTFTVRYRVEKSSAPNGSSPTLVGSNGMAATHQAQTAGSASGQAKVAGAPTSTASLASPSDWITIRPRSTGKNGANATDDDRIEYLCDLSPTGEYTIYVAATNDVGRSDVDYTISMASDELRHSYLRDAIDYLSGLPNVFAYVPSLLLFLMAALFLALLSLILYTSAIKYYQKFVIMHNQMRATRRAKQDEKRRRKLNNQRHQQKLDLWADDYEEEEDDEEDEEDGDEGDDEDGSSASSNAIHPHPFNRPSNGHYISNIANSAFDTSSIDSRPCNKYSGSCVSTASTDSIHGGRFQCLNSKQYVKMNEYTMLPSISATLSPPNDIYGPIGAQQPLHQQQQSLASQQQQANSSLYYSTLRRSNMQTYLPNRQRQQPPQQTSPSQAPLMRMSPSQQQQQQQHSIHRRRSQNVADIYGYYLAPQASAANTSQQQVDEAANSIFVPPQQIIYSAPNIRRQPVFL